MGCVSNQGCIHVHCLFMSLLFMGVVLYVWHGVLRGNLALSSLFFESILVGYSSGSSIFRLFSFLLSVDAEMRE